MVILIWALLFWVGVFALIKWLEVRLDGKISRWCKARNISLYLGYISWTTTRYNSSLTKLSQKYRRWWDLWFSLGVTFGLVGLIFSMVVMVGNLVITIAHLWVVIQGNHAQAAVSAAAIPDMSSGMGQGDVGASMTRTLQSIDGGKQYTERFVDAEFMDEMQRAEETVKLAGQDIGRSSGILTPLLPGVNLPKSQIGYIIIALMFSALFHELGHALAAGAEELRLNGVGGFFALIFPGAFVQIDGIDGLPPWRQLKVYCAGAWHNIAVSVACVVAISFLPLMLFPFYAYHNGAVVTNVPADSVLYKHIVPGDVIREVNSEPISDRFAFMEALDRLQSSTDQRNFGFCFSDAMLKERGRPMSECCGPDADASSGFQCFSDRTETTPQKWCVKPGAASLQPKCFTRGDCADELGASDCFYPELPDGQQLHDVRVVNWRDGADRRVIFQGTSETLQNSVVLSNYLPRRSFLSTALPGLYDFVVTIDIPRKIDRLFQYTFSVSLCLAVLNMAPVFSLDGEASSILFVRIFRPRMSDLAYQRLKSFLLMTGTFLLAGNIVMSLAVMKL